MTSPFAYWNYRVLKQIRHGEAWFSIIEVHYDANHRLVAYSDDHTPGGEDLDDLVGEMDLMMQALQRPVLTEDDLPKGILESPA